MSTSSSKKNRSKDDYVIRCPECNGQVVTDGERGERSCEACGLIVDTNMIDMNIDFRAYDDEQEKVKSHIGPPSSETMHDKGLSTEIDPAMKDSHGRSIPVGTRREVHRLRKWQKKLSIKNSQERNLVFALTEISKKTSHMELTEDVKKETIFIYKKAVDENIIRGRSISAVIAASFYLASRVCGQPRTLDEIGMAMDVSRKECGRIARFMRRRFNIKIEPPTGADFLERFCQSMHLKDGILHRARELMGVCEESGLYSGKAPMGLVAAVIYTAVEDYNISLPEEKRLVFTQKDVADRCSVTEVTLRNRCKDIRTIELLSTPSKL